MKRHVFVVSLVLVLLLMVSVGSLAEELVFSDSFEDNVVGENPVGWNVLHPEAGLIIDANHVSISDGHLALQMNNTPELFGEVWTDIPEVAVGKLVVDFYQPNSSRENINVEVHNDDGRIVGIFITGSGNVRVRDAGEQSDNILNLGNDSWHTLVVTWDDEFFNVYYVNANGEEVVIREGLLLDPAAVGKPGNKILFNVSPRDDAKEAFIDNVRVYSLD